MAAEVVGAEEESAGVQALPTVAEVLDFESLRRGCAEVVAGARGLGSRVRWVHVSELPGINEALAGGELLLTTGIALPDKPSGLAGYIRALSAAGLAGIVIGLGPRFTDELPAPMLAAADECGLPLILLRRFTRFIDVTEDVQARIVAIQVEELRASERIHAIFHELAVEGVGLADIVHQVARMAGCPVVLENLVHQVLAYDTAGRPADSVIGNWEMKSRRVRPVGRTEYDPASQWLVSAVGARGKVWGRLVMVSPAAPLRRQEILIERAAGTLALSRLLDRDDAALESRAHTSLLAGWLSPRQSADDLAVEAEALGVPLTGRQLIGVAMRPDGDDGSDAVERQNRLRALAELAATAARSTRSPALVGPVDDRIVAVLLSLQAGSDETAVLDRLVRQVRLHCSEPLMIGVGSTVTNVAQIRNSLIEASQITDAARHLSIEREYFRSTDLRLRGLLEQLRNDPRLQDYAERELGPLIDYDRAHGTMLVSVLRAYLYSGRNKTAAAERAHVSRPWMHECLARVETVLGVELESEDACVSLQVALMALDAMRP